MWIDDSLCTTKQILQRSIVIEGVSLHEISLGVRVRETDWFGSDNALNKIQDICVQQKIYRKNA